MPLLSKLEFGSYLTYSPRGDSAIANQSRSIRNSLKFDKKGGDPPTQFTQYIVNEIVSNLHSLPFKDFFGENVLLVPVPNSGLMKEGTLWVPHRLVKEMTSHGLGIESTCLKRVKAVRKSATNPLKSRCNLIRSSRFTTVKYNGSL